MYQVYVVKLDNGKYFIGHTKKTRNLPEQIEKLNIEWLKINPIKQILKVYNHCDKYDVDKYTKKYMEVYGVENVRGGSYYNVNIRKEELEQIKKEFEKKEIYEYESSSEKEEKEEYIEDSFDKIEKEFEIINKCSRCGSNEHYVYQCFKEFEPEIKNVKRCKKCRDYGHLKDECPISKKQKVFEKLQKFDNKVIEIIETIKNLKN